MRTLVLPFAVPEPVLERAAGIRLLVFDVDGVLTDGSLYLRDDGREYKAFHSRDGHGMQMLRAAGVRLAVISGRSSEVVARRMAELGVEHVQQGCRDKRAAFARLLEETAVAAGAAGFAGDDVVDLPAMLDAGLAVAVRDAHPLVKHHADWITPSPGGRGAAREICELILYAQGRYEAAMLGEAG